MNTAIQQPNVWPCSFAGLPWSELLVPLPAMLRFALPRAAFAGEGDQRHKHAVI